MKPLSVCGLGFFTPGYPDLGAYLDGKLDAARPKPEAALLAGLYPAWRISRRKASDAMRFD